MAQNNRLHLWMFFKFVSTFFHLVGTFFHSVETFFSVVKEKKRRRNFFPFLFGVFYNFTTYNDFLLLNQWRRPKCRLKSFQNQSKNQLMNIQKYAWAGCLSLQNLKKKIFNFTPPEYQSMLLLACVIYKYMTCAIRLGFNMTLACFLYLSGLDSNKVLIPALLKYINSKTNNTHGKQKVQVWISDNYLNFCRCIKLITENSAKYLIRILNAKYIMHLLLAKLMVSTSIGPRFLLMPIFTALMCVSTDCSSSRSSENQSSSSGQNESFESADGIPYHEFYTEKKRVNQKGKAKGKKKYNVTLEIGPYSFKRKNDAKVGNVAVFSCNLCSKVKCGTYAYARKMTEKNGKPTYELERFPEADKHDCVPSSTLILAKKLMIAAKKLIEKNPTHSVAKCYTEARSKFTSKMSDIEQKQFIAEISTLHNSNSNLYKFRNRFIPKDPPTASDFNTKSDWFETDNGENICKANIEVGNRRIVVMSTDKLLKHMERCTGLSIDGTFRSCPKQWYQLLVLSGEITPGYWCPLIYIFCPDKQESTYTLAFQAIADKLKDMNIKLAADYFQCDFEMGLRNAIRTAFGNDIQLKGCHFHYGTSLNIRFKICVYFKFVLYIYHSKKLFYKSNLYDNFDHEI